MTISIIDGVASRSFTDLTPIDQAELIQSREAAVLAQREAQAHLTPEQIIQAGEDAARQLFG